MAFGRAAGRNNAGAAPIYDAGKSLNFPGISGSRVSRTFTQNGSRTKGSICFRLKKTRNDTVQYIQSGNSNYEFIGFLADNKLRISHISGTPYWITKRLFVDISAHLDLLIAWDTTQALPENRCRVYLNGAEITEWDSKPDITQNSQFVMWNTSGYISTIGGSNYFDQNFDGPITEVFWIAGEQLNPSFFGSFNTDEVWVPGPYQGTFSDPNSFHLDFKDGQSLTTLGHDKSGNNNHFTLENFSLTPGDNYCWTEDSISENFATFNPLNKSSAITVSAGGLKAYGSGAPLNITSTIPVPFSGKYYLEFISSTPTNASVGIGFGFHPIDAPLNSQWNAAGAYKFYASAAPWIVADGVYTVVSGYINQAGKFFKMAINADEGKVWLGQEDVWWDSSGGTTGNPETNSNPTFNVDLRGYDIVAHFQATFTWIINAGQRPYGKTPPNNYGALKTSRLPSVLNKNPSESFDIALATGPSIKSVAESVFSGHYVAWIKERFSSTNHQMVSTLLGLSNVLRVNKATPLSAYDEPLTASVAWVFKAGSGIQANNVGSIQSQVSSNAKAGFSALTYYGTSATATVGHGLDDAPELVITKGLDGPVLNPEWCVWHTAMLGTEYIWLNRPNVKQVGATRWNSLKPTSQVVNLGTDGDTNYLNQHYFMLCFRSVPGSSMVSKFKGSAAAGKFVWCGFKPKFLMIKALNVASDWVIIDAGRNPYNRANLALYPSAPNSEENNRLIDIFSNGFAPMVGTGYGINDNTDYIFVALAETPFGGYNVAPCLAR